MWSIKSVSAVRNQTYCGHGLQGIILVDEVSVCLYLGSYQSIFESPCPDDGPSLVIDGLDCDRTGIKFAIPKRR